MTAFHVGQRVRIKWSKGWPELAGEPGVIVSKSDNGGIFGASEWIVAPDIWGTHVAPYPSRHGGDLFAPNSEQLEPLTDSNELVSWESVRDLWVPEHLRVEA
jgi:hypothetical protein